MGLVSADARWTNAAGDFALCIGHMCFLAKVVPRTVKSARAKELKAFVVAYFVFLAAFQGVCIDAEVPGTAPPAEEVFR